MDNLNNEMFHPKVDETFQKFYEVLDGFSIKNLEYLSSLLMMLKCDLEQENLINDGVVNQFNLAIGILSNIESKIQKFTIEHHCIGETLGDVLNRFVKFEQVEENIEHPLYKITYYLGGKKHEVRKHVINNYTKLIGWDVFGYLFDDIYNSDTIVTKEVLNYILLTLFKHEDFDNETKRLLITLLFDNHVYSVMGKITPEQIKSMKNIGIDTETHLIKALLHEMLIVDVTNIECEKNTTI